ncbi:nuclear transport factor 2 family protein [Roseomonas sp. M0104]|uniref:Nuclear transport factor 2 family protein n=1 Tax=Teichococcus coralli TaxID=2545983 RepID=A0A845BBC3_9PROT|nr:nuclear transport factor 2 family protein [Pseudoroseomonas coralli]MXP64461.1 nuclear transport factor 2 family protein [Pseudoroseomonas coralli]
MTATDAQALATRYIAAWNETDPARRLALLAALWTEDATYRDPLMQGTGHEAIAALVAAVQARFPGHRFSLAGRADGYADRLRFSWTLGPDSGEPLVAGTDFAQLAGDGRLHTVTGFLDPLPGEA